MFEIGKYYKQKPGECDIIVKVTKKNNDLQDTYFEYECDAYGPGGWSQKVGNLWNREIYEEISEEEFLIYRVSFK
jgi:hypothetical protein